MIESFALSSAITVPMFLLLLCGVALRHWHILDEKAFSSINKLCFFLLLPASLVNNIISAKDFSIVRWQFLIWLLICQGIILCVAVGAVSGVIKESKARASAIQTLFRSNFLMYGIAIATYFCNPEELVVVSVAAGMLIPIYNLGGIMILQSYCGGTLGIKQIISIFLKNPFVIACAIGALIVATGLHLPVLIATTLGSIAKSAVTIGFIAVGGSLDVTKIVSVGKQALYVTFLRLVCFPAIIIGLTVFVGFRGVELLTVVVMMISPTAVATYALAEQMGADKDLSAYLIVTQSIFSLISMFAWIMVLKNASLL